MDSTGSDRTFQLPDDLVEKLADLSESLGETEENMVIAAVEHFTMVDSERRKAIVMGAARRRRP